jgi:hypothetical protein
MAGSERQQGSDIDPELEAEDLSEDEYVYLTLSLSLWLLDYLLAL